MVGHLLRSHSYSAGTPRTPCVWAAGVCAWRRRGEAGVIVRRHFFSACNPVTLFVCILSWAARECAWARRVEAGGMMRILQRGHFYSVCNPTKVCVCILLCAARGCTGLYFYAYDSNSWTSTVMVFRNTTVRRDTGWLEMNPYTNATVGRALYQTTFEMQNSANGSLSSFNTSFVFSMNTNRSQTVFGDGLAFLICPNPFRGEDLQVSSGGYLGMFNSSTNGLARNNLFAIEFDTHQNPPFRDPNDNHVGVDVNSVTSLRTNDLTTLGIVLNEGKRIICWIDYDGDGRYLWVYLALSPSDKPSSPAIAMALDLAPYMRDYMYVGFTSATGASEELHTIFSWWFLSGYGKLTLPLFPPSSRRPLASLSQKSIAIAIFSLAVVIGFLCFFCIYAQRRWQKQSKHLIDILLPVACWMYWKENTTCEVHSTRCLKLAAPTVELLAWLWRTRLARKHNEPQVKTWQKMFLKCKMGLHYRGEAWQLEDKRRKRRRQHNALVYEEPIGEGIPGVEDDTRGRMKVFKRMRPAPEGKVEEVETPGRKEEAVVVRRLVLEEQPCKPESQGKDKPALKAGGLARTVLKAGAKGKGKVPKSHIIGSDPFFVVNKKSDEQLFQRRESFSILQSAVKDKVGHDLALEPAMDVGSTLPVVAAPWIQLGPETAGPSKVKMVKGHKDLQLEIAYITDDHTNDESHMRRWSSSAFPEDAIDLTGTPIAEEGRDEPSVQYLAKQDVDSGADGRRGSSSGHPEVAVDLMGLRSAEGDGKETLVQFLVDCDSKRGADVRVECDAKSSSARRMGRAFTVVENACFSLEPGTNDESKGADNTSHDHLQDAAASAQFSKPSRHPSSSANNSSKPHVEHRWLFD